VYTEIELDLIFDKTRGVCACCGKEIVRKNYAGEAGTHGWWEVAYASPGPAGESDRWKSLWPICLVCNRGMRAVDVKRWSGRPDAAH
jgi:hypothetical protein